MDRFPDSATLLPLFPRHDGNGNGNGNGNGDRGRWWRRRTSAIVGDGGDDDDDDDDLPCGELFLRDIHVTANDCTKECDRRYMLYIPTFVCEQQRQEKVISQTNDDHPPKVAMHLPVVFSIHCLGCHLETMKFWSEIAEAYNFIWVNPEGLHHSFNAGDESCCGYALEQGIDDIGFLQSIIVDDLMSVSLFGSSSESSPSASFRIHPDWVYGMGWSNGGYLVTAAAHLFRAIAPISGYQIEELSLVTKPTGLFLHHASDDHFVRPTGCCTDHSMPSCCCHLSDVLQECTSIEGHVHRWATEINDCAEEEEGSGGVGGGMDILPSIREGVTCYTYRTTGNCQANTTYCIHSNHNGHFNAPSFERAFPMSWEIADFFARDACTSGGIGGGADESQDHHHWDSKTRTCTCAATYRGLYCLDRAEDVIKTTPDTVKKVDQEEEWVALSASTMAGTGEVIAVLSILLTAVTLIYWYRRRGGRRPRFPILLGTNDHDKRILTKRVPMVELAKL